ncbi:MAG: hypothetical protein AAFR61_08580 [Bacteroidota bacterium]
MNVHNRLFCLTLFAFLFSAVVVAQDRPTIKMDWGIDSQLTVSGWAVFEPNAQPLTIMHCSRLLPGNTLPDFSSGELPDTIWVPGSWDYGFYINDEKDAGSIAFTYRFAMIEGKAHFYFQDFVHDATGTEFGSLGPLIFRDTEESIAPFTKEQYGQLLYNLRLNVVGLINSWYNSTKRCMDG